jgi:hypothetical protein
VDVANRVKTIFSNDTAQAKAAVQILRGVERERAKEMLDHLNRENAALQSSIATWTKVGVAIGGTIALYKGLQHSAAAALEDARLNAAAAGASVSRLREATHGLVEEDKLLTFAGKAQAGAWKLNQDEMDRVLRGAMALRKTMGVELNPTIDALTEALAKGSTRALKEFGIVAQDKQGVLRELDRRVSRLGGNTALAGDEFQAAGVKGADALDHLAEAAGRLAVKLGPLVDKIASLVDGLAAAADAISSDSAETTVSFLRDALVSSRPKGMAGQVIADGVDFGNFGKQWVNQATTRIRAQQEMGKLGAAVGLNWMLDAQDALTAGVTAVIKNYKKPKRRGGAAGSMGGLAGADPLVAFPQLFDASASAFSDVGGALTRTFDQARAGVTLGEEDGTELARFRALMETARRDAAEMQAELAAAKSEQQQTFLESIFGPVDQFNAYAAGFQLLQGAATSAFDAWITGATSMGDAIKHSIAEGLRGVASQMLIESLKHAAFALGSLAFFDFRGAGQHAAAAAAFGAGAIAAGAAARALGAGQGPAASARGGVSGGAGYALGGGTSSGGGRGGSGDVTNVYYLSSDWDDMTPTERRQRLARAVKRGNVTHTTNIVSHR